MERGEFLARAHARLGRIRIFAAAVIAAFIIACLALTVWIDENLGITAITLVATILLVSIGMRYFMMSVFVQYVSTIHASISILPRYLPPLKQHERLHFFVHSSLTNTSYFNAFCASTLTSGYIVFTPACAESSEQVFRFTVAHEIGHHRTRDVLWKSAEGICELVLTLAIVAVCITILPAADRSLAFLFSAIAAIWFSSSMPWSQWIHKKHDTLSEMRADMFAAMHTPDLSEVIAFFTNMHMGDNMRSALFGKRIIELCKYNTLTRS